MPLKSRPKVSLATSSVEHRNPTRLGLIGIVLMFTIMVWGCSFISPLISHISNEDICKALSNWPPGCFHVNNYYKRCRPWTTSDPCKSSSNDIRVPYFLELNNSYNHDTYGYNGGDYDPEWSDNDPLYGD